MLRGRAARCLGLPREHQTSRLPKKDKRRKKGKVVLRRGACSPPLALVLKGFCMNFYLIYHLKHSEGGYGGSTTGWG
ncbi:hypothetical protein MGG_17488 [Pyricularia oryzae 70-15]|uniref:Uncharacterized protein n=3 Tax=Pyricularia oryzae TaxID=318829 RepID=G4NDB9_PYRO7|nr:uncharacterized protein MGG_17488 [Pyricularia oryzae 70-15]EHA49257.1 hypothetical protein MGG_17488 [Pyricularia oryzae 70-15]ELQ35992.1 hypothetical protein OOU_Y34scaffold00672g10 [Pyricularia oryzae Y34]KAI7910813.1 hypothetical protein M9X92_010880 [Pyricularia oryzae]KAI7917472.1 hypothetical protein M0657_008062 [Pyricularia oryzae]